MLPIIHVENLHYTYTPERAAPVQALRGVNLTVYTGEYLVILGHNGSGKSTLAKHFNALLRPTQGNVWVKGWNTRERAYTLNIRSTVGMVFQHPDNQFVATIVEEDVAFGPENLGVPRDELLRRVDWSLDRVEMSRYRHRAPHLLSGGQKQRVCIAGVLAMKPEVLVLDEATAMLDPLGRREVLDVVRRLNRGEGVTVIAITHYMEEAVEADRVIIMEEGRIALEGTPREVFRQVKRLQQLQMDVPQVTQLALRLGLDNVPLTVKEFVNTMRSMPSLLAPPPPREGGAHPLSQDEKGQGMREAVIHAESLTHFYMRGTPLEVKAIDGVNLEVRRGEVLGIIGHTGSGKSTVVQHFNALLRPHGGRVIVFGQDLSDSKLDVLAIRKRVGLVFQSPEAQLFEQYVGDDVAYGPRNLKLSKEEVRERVRRALNSVGLPFEEFKDRITFGLSGGQMRRVALAGVLALEPDVLVLDEPTAGLDPRGREQLWELILRLREERNITLVVISHNMAELARVCDRLVVMADGRTVMAGTPREIFADAARLRELGLGVPDITEAFAELWPEAEPVLTVEEGLELLAKRVEPQRGEGRKG
ncbi:MAG: energy-coupling factor transporter ATPase [Anaerolineales bacterium]|nr:energy-coupling factor transporter ATPase [Anaerolineales bacterium]